MVAHPPQVVGGGQRRDGGMGQGDPLAAVAPGRDKEDLRLGADGLPHPVDDPVHRHRRVLSAAHTAAGAPAAGLADRIGHGQILHQGAPGLQQRALPQQLQDTGQIRRKRTDRLAPGTGRAAAAQHRYFGGAALPDGGAGAAAVPQAGFALAPAGAEQILPQQVSRCFAAGKQARLPVQSQALGYGGGFLAQQGRRQQFVHRCVPADPEHIVQRGDPAAWLLHSVSSLYCPNCTERAPARALARRNPVLFARCEKKPFGAAGLRRPSRTDLFTVPKNVRSGL